MQAVACIFRQVCDYFKLHLEETPPHDGPRRYAALAGKGQPMMAPILIVGAMLVLVVWDTSDV
jgi:hypothetical protein